MKSIKELEKFIKKYSWNPLVTTKDYLNNVDLKKSAEINKENLDYLKSLSKK